MCFSQKRCSEFFKFGCCCLNFDFSFSVQKYFTFVPYIQAYITDSGFVQNGGAAGVELWFVQDGGACGVPA